MTSKKGGRKKASKSRASKASKGKSSKAASKKKNAATALTQKNENKKEVKRSAAVGKFVSAKTGRVVKATPATPRLGRDRIKNAVSGVVCRDAKRGRVSG